MPNRYTGLVTVTLVAIALSGCAASGGTPSKSVPGGSHSSGVHSTPHPSATSADPADPTRPTVDPTVLFTITAKLSSDAGATADLSEIVYKPVDATDQMSKDEALANDPDLGCPNWLSLIPNEQFLVGKITVTDTSPAGASWPADAYGLALLDFDGGHPVYSGAMNFFQAVCDTGVFVTLGETRAVSPVNPTSPDEQYGWASYSYGFYAEPGEFAGTIGSTITDCSLTLSDYATANSVVVQGWAAQPQPYPGTSCAFGARLFAY